MRSAPGRLVEVTGHLEPPGPGSDRSRSSSWHHAIELVTSGDRAESGCQPDTAWVCQKKRTQQLGPGPTEPATEDTWPGPGPAPLYHD